MLHEYLTLSESPEALSEYYSFLSSKNRSKEAANPFASLTESKIPSLPGMSMLDSGSYTIDGPLSLQQMRRMFQYLFPDEDPENKFPYGNVKDEQVTLNMLSLSSLSKRNIQFDPQKIKSAVPDSLVHRLSIILANIYTTFSGRRGVAQFWAEFSQKMRDRVEKCAGIPG